MIRRLPRDAEADEARWFEAASGARCPPPDLLTAVLSGAVHEPMATKVRDHLAACEACRVLADVLMNDEAVEPTADEGARIRRRVERTGTRPAVVWRLAAAAAILVAVAGVVLFRFAWPRQAGAPDLARRGSGDIQLRAPAFVLALEKPALTLPESALVLRSARIDPYAKALDEALEPYRRDDFAGAVERLTGVTRSWPRQPHAAFYLGVSLLMANRAADALQPLNEAARFARGNEWLSGEAAWYLAVAQERAGDPAAAARVLAPLCAGRGTRRDAACRGMRELAGTSPRDQGGQGATEPDRSRRGSPGSPPSDGAGVRPGPGA